VSIGESHNSGRNVSIVEGVAESSDDRLALSFERVGSSDVTRCCCRDGQQWCWIVLVLSENFFHRVCHPNHITVVYWKTEIRTEELTAASAVKPDDNTTTGHGFCSGQSESFEVIEADENGCSPESRCGLLFRDAVDLDHLPVIKEPAGMQYAHHDFGFGVTFPRHENNRPRRLNLGMVERLIYP